MALKHLAALLVATCGLALAASKADIANATEQVALAVDGVISRCPTELTFSSTIQCIRADIDLTTARRLISSQLASRLFGAWRSDSDPSFVYNWISTPSGPVIVAAASPSYGQVFLALDGLTPVAAPKVTVTPRLTRTLKLTSPRMHGADVVALQNRLMDVSHTPRGAGGDGWYGPITQANVIAFQAANGLPVNGVVDQRTWQLLFSNQARGYDNSLQQLAKQLGKR